MKHFQFNKVSNWKARFHVFFTANEMSVFCVVFVDFLWFYHSGDSSYPPCDSARLVGSCSSSNVWFPCPTLKLPLPSICLGPKISFSNSSACEILFLDDNWMRATRKCLIWNRKTSDQITIDFKTGNKVTQVDGDDRDRAKGDQRIPGKTEPQGPPGIPGINVNNRAKGELRVKGPPGQKGESGTSGIVLSWGMAEIFLCSVRFGFLLFCLFPLFLRCYPYDVLITT